MPSPFLNLNGHTGAMEYERLAEVAAAINPDQLSLDGAAPIFADQDSGCLSYGLEIAGHRWFVKVSRTEAGARSLENAVRFHQAVRHSAIVAPIRVFREPELTLLYPWVPGRVLRHATTAGSDRRGLHRLRARSLDEVRAAITTVLDAHRHVVARGFVAVDFYDGAMFYDFDASEMYLIDLDQYRPGPFVLDGDRLPGSRTFMAPEEFRRGATIDQRTTVFVLGRMIHHLLISDDGWRGLPPQAALIQQATAERPADRFPTVEDLIQAWDRSWQGQPEPA